MLKIRLSRTGKKHQPHYRIIVCEERSKRDGKTVDNLGHWHPDENKLVVNKEIYSLWLSRGAIPTQAIQKLLA